MVQYEITVRGRVQGVGFRYFAKKQADIFGLKGQVKNTTSGHVRVIVQGEKETIDTFVDYLRIGPSLARVHSVSIVPVELTGTFPDFSVQY